MAPILFCTTAPAPSPSESGPGMRLPPSACSSPARTCSHTRQSVMPRPTARRRHSGQAGQRPPRQPFCTHSGLVFRPPCPCTFIPGAAKRTPRTVFSQCRRGFLHTLGWLLLPSLHSSDTHSTSRDRQRGLTSDLTSSEASAHGRALWRAMPLDPDWLRQTTYLARVPCTLSLACKYIALLYVFNNNQNCQPLSLLEVHRLQIFALLAANSPSVRLKKGPNKIKKTAVGSYI
jgi:hypothetical protein